MLVAIMLDAFNHRYLEFEAPFISSIMARAHVTRVIPAFGFEPDAAHIAGLWPELSDGGMHFWWGPEGSVFRWTTPWGRFAARLPTGAQRVVRRGIQATNLAVARPLGRKYGGNPVGIPLERLHLFDVSQSRVMFQPGFSASPTIFDLLSQQQRPWKYFGSPVHRSKADRLARRIEKADLRNVDFVFVSMADLDKVGHVYGTRGVEIQDAWRRVDSAVERIYRHCLQDGKPVELVIYGDHGMVDVTSHIDLRPALRRLRSREWVDYAYFLDSTFARFWTFTDEAKAEIMEMLDGVPGGSLVTTADRERYRCAYSHNRFGDIIFWADEGHILLPNFYQKLNPVRGMHGYRREVIDNHTGLIAYAEARETGHRLPEPVEMVDIFATLVDMLALPWPDAADGRSVLQP
ncbi:MAG: hypothetical protein HKM89_09625 [Gemmatimonadales bacterium]|nr:hypothetical protein [Gemmatimonadales bacterium]